MTIKVLLSVVSNCECGEKDLSTNFKAHIGDHQIDEKWEQNDDAKY
jgi:hypothetical protein